MSLDIGTALKVLFASAPQNVRPIQVLEFAHSAFSQTWYFWREPAGALVTTEDGDRWVEPLNFETKLAGSEANLDQVFDILVDLTDLDDAFREQLDAVPLNTTERILCTYREYRSDDLATIEVGPSELQVEAISYQKGAARISAVSPRLNVTRTGELYAPRFIPMLRGFL